MEHLPGRTAGWDLRRRVRAGVADREHDDLAAGQFEDGHALSGGEVDAGVAFKMLLGRLLRAVRREGQAVFLDRRNDGQLEWLLLFFGLLLFGVFGVQAVDAFHYAITVLFAECVMRLPADSCICQPVSR